MRQKQPPGGAGPASAGGKDRSGQPRANGTPNVRAFGTTTGQLRELADWLAAEGIESVAMESTHVYWIPLHELLEKQGFEVLLVNARQLRSAPGRKTDMQDCQWLLQLHSCGLLRDRSGRHTTLRSDEISALLPLAGRTHPCPRSHDK